MLTREFFFDQPTVLFAMAVLLGVAIAAGFTDSGEAQPTDSGEAQPPEATVPAGPGRGGEEAVSETDEAWRSAE